MTALVRPRGAGRGRSPGALVEQAGQGGHVLLQGVLEFFAVEDGGGVVGDENRVAPALEGATAYPGQFDARAEYGADGRRPLGARCGGV